MVLELLEAWEVESLGLGLVFDDYGDELDIDA